MKRDVRTQRNKTSFHQIKDLLDIERQIWELRMQAIKDYVAQVDEIIEEMERNLESEKI
jgi:GTP-dependent phosphoenolpyruvate carboxykinase